MQLKQNILYMPRIKRYKTFRNYEEQSKIEEAEKFFKYKTFIRNIKHIFELIILFIRIYIFKYNYHSARALYFK